MNFLKFLIFNVLLLASEVYCTELKLSCVEKGSDTSVSGFDARFYLSTGKRRKNHRIKSKGEKLKTFLNNQGFKDNRKTVVLIHGFLNNHRGNWVADLKGNLTKRRDLNVIQMDWSDAFFNKHIEVDDDLIDTITDIELLDDSGLSDAAYYLYDYDDSDEVGDDDANDESDEDVADDDTIIPEELNPLDYKSAALRTELAAIKLSKLLIRIAKTRPKPKKFLRRLHLIGHSLGAHVAGQTGRLLKQKTKVQVMRVTGLDPAYPCFQPEKRPTLKLDINDAKFVDVIHTNSKPNSNSNFGIYNSLGHMDFYPNRGYNQPNCDLNRRRGKSIEYIKDLIKKVLVGTLDYLVTSIFNVDTATNIVLNYDSNERFDIICDHGEATKYFIQSLSKDIYAVPAAVPIEDRKVINNLKNELRKCAASKNCVKMGYYADRYASRPGTYYVDPTI